MMKRVVPDYYPQFRCIAGECRHNCCIGWEIDVDEDTLRYYQSLAGELGERLRKNIDFSADPPHFILSEHERCPFLNDRNLCDLILEKGEGALCQICDDHPRFYNDFSDRVEMGVGLCCEAAGRLILGKTEKTQLISLDDAEEALEEEETALLQLRGQLFQIVQDRTLSLDQRMQKVLCQVGAALPEASIADWAQFLMTLEQLDPAWQGHLKQLQQMPLRMPDAAFDTAFEQLLHYFLYRHLPGALEDGCVPERVAFAVLSVMLVRALCGLKENAQLEDIVEFSRMYSSEIEYSDENVGALLEALTTA